MRWATHLICALALVVQLPVLASPLAEGAGAVPDLDRLVEQPGAALRAAVESLEAGNALLGDALLGAIAKRHRVIADHADLLRMQLRIDTQRYGEAIELRQTWDHADSPLRAEFYALLGQAYAARGEEERSRATWEYAALEIEDGARRAEIQLAIADSYRRTGQTRQAIEGYVGIWSREPGTPAADSAALALDEIERARGRSVRSASDHRKRADALYKRRRNEDALAAYDHALGLGLAGREKVQARHDRAQTLFRLRRYTEAAQAFAALPPSEERQIQHARALARSSRVLQGARELEALGARSRSRQGTRALLLAGLLRDGEGQRDEAFSLFERVVKRSPRSGYAAAARWRLAWAAYREARLEQAITHFEGLEASEDDAVAALRPRYWRIRASERLGDPEAAAEYADLFPFSYYGWRARERSTGVAAARAPEPIRNGTTALDPAVLERPRILLEAGLVDASRQELDRLARRARGVHDRLALAQLYANAGNFHRPQRLMVDAYTEQLARGPVPGHVELWWHAWPAPFDEEMRGARLDGMEVAPELVYSVMREESGYRPGVVSVSGARGLLQLMPATAERVARESRIGEFSADDLFEPRVNIRLGSDYLAGLLRRFEGRASAAIGSYNAGPHVVARWIEARPGEDDVWVEEIPYDQTRGYVKRVLRSVQAYRVLY
jgi:soluble lytic murein transglycosylase